MRVLVVESVKFGVYAGRVGMAYILRSRIFGIISAFLIFVLRL